MKISLKKKSNIFKQKDITILKKLIIEEVKHSEDHEVRAYISKLVKQAKKSGLTDINDIDKYVRNHITKNSLGPLAPKGN
jgi:16S rRNA G527 N7-methylase RsmG